MIVLAVLSGLSMVAAVSLLVIFCICVCLSVVGRTINDDIKHLYTKNGRILRGTVEGDTEQIRLGYNEGGGPNALLEPYFGEMMLKIGMAYVDFPSCPAIHLAMNLGYRHHLNAATLLLSLGADPNLYQLPESDPFQPSNHLYNRGFPPALLFALGLGQEPDNSHAGLIDRLLKTNPSVFNLTTIERWRAETGNPPLVHLALMLGHIDGAHVLLKRLSLPVDEADEGGLTPLHVSAWTGDIPAMIMLLQQGANVSAADAHGRTALHYVAMRGHPVPAAEILLASTNFSTQCKPDNHACKRKLKTALLTKVDIYGRSAYDLASAAPARVALRDYLAEQAKLLSSGNTVPPAAGTKGNRAVSSFAATTASAGALAQRLASTGALALTVDRLDATDAGSSTTSTRFYREYYIAQRPVLITGQLTAQAAIWEQVRRESFVARYGGLRARTGPDTYNEVLQPFADNCTADGRDVGLDGSGELANSVAPDLPSRCRSITSIGLADYIKSCFAPNRPSDPPSGRAFCSWSAHVPDASTQLPAEWAADLTPPELFTSICTVPTDEPATPTSNSGTATVSSDPSTINTNTTATSTGVTNEDASQRKWRRNGVVEPLQLHVAPAVTVMPFQAHNATWDLLLSGRKKWFLIPPGGLIDAPASVGATGGNATGQGQPAGQSEVERLLGLVVSLRESRVVAEVLQAPGEVVFIPHDWKYALLHLEDSISVSQQFCTFLHSDARIQPLGTVLYGGEDPFRGIGLYKTHRASKYEIGVTLPKTSKIPQFDFAPVT